MSFELLTLVHEDHSERREHHRARLGNQTLWSRNKKVNDESERVQVELHDVHINCEREKKPQILIKKKFTASCTQDKLVSLSATGQYISCETRDRSGGLCAYFWISMTCQLVRSKRNMVRLCLSNSHADEIGPRR